MNAEVKELDETYKRALLELAAQGTQGEFTVDRAPEFFAWPRGMGHTRFLGIGTQQELLAVVGLTQQQRFINGRETTTTYLHDLRLHPVKASPLMYGKLVKAIKTMCGENALVFASVLDANPKAKTITRGKSVFPQAVSVARIVHTGFPLFAGSKKGRSTIQEMPANEAWDFYLAQARGQDFALYHREHFMSQALVFVGVFVNGVPVAMAKISHQEDCRNIVLNRPLKAAERFINLYCRLRQRQGLPRQHQRFRHLYLSYFVGQKREQYLQDLVRYTRKKYAREYAYVFTGLVPHEASKYQKPLHVQFSSQVYTYGKWPAVQFHFPELTLI